MSSMSIVSYSSVESLDLERLKWKITRKHPTIDSEGIEMMEREYKRFLTLKIIYPKQSFAPTRNMDVMWHAHILDTANYRMDCHKLFGKFLNHRPYFGPYSSNGVYEEMEGKFEKLHHYYHEVFGEYPVADLDEVREKLSSSAGDCDDDCDDFGCDDNEAADLEHDTID